MKVNHPQDKYLVDRVHQLIYNTLVTNYIDKKAFDYI